MNNETLEAFPSMATICKESKLSEPTVRKYIKELVDNSYISIIRKGRKNFYKFNPYKQFEIFSYDFLDSDLLSAYEKAILISSQQYMFKDEDTHEGKINYSNRELATKIGTSRDTVNKVFNSLEKKGMMQSITLNTVDQETGCKRITKVFDFDKLMQGIVFCIKNHEERLQIHDKEIATHNKEIAMLKQQIEELRSQLDMKKEIVL